MKIKGLSGTIIIAIIFCSSLASASYIKADFNIDEAGNVIVSGETDNSPNIEGIELNGTKLSGTAALTNKIKDIWEFKLSLDYDESDITINLPKGASILNIETENKLSISNDLNQIILEVKETSPINIEFFYSIGITQPSLNISTTLSYIFIAVVLINAFVIYYLYVQLKKKPKKIIQKKVEKADKAKILYDTLNEKEKKIIEAVKAGASYQAKIMNDTGIPKASLSRYINNLIKKEFLIRKGEGKLAEIKLQN